MIHDTPSPRHLDEISLHEEEYKHDHHDDNTIKVVTFNVLASCYALKSSSYQTHCSPEHLDGQHRFTEIGHILRECNADIIALQEVDQIDDSLKWMDLQHSSEYHTFYQQRSNKKQDGLILGFKPTKYQLYGEETLRVISLNDLTMGCSSENSVQYFKKDQIAIYLILQPLHDPNHLLFVVNTHLYWHPDADDIRLRQMAYILNVVHSKAQRLISDENSPQNTIKKISLIFCGDFNTLPNTAPHDFMLNGSFRMKAKGNSTLKLIMDAACNKVARWCRSMGVDTAYFKEQKLDTKNAEKLFSICKREERILVTRSKSLVARRDCPSHLLLDNSIPHHNLKQIIKYFGIEYDDDALYTRCTLCNGNPIKMTDRKEIENEEQIPSQMKVEGEQMETFWKCPNCRQVYWYGGKTKNEAEKFRRIFAESAVEMEHDLKERRERLEKRLRKESAKRKRTEEKKGDDIENEDYESDIGDLDDKLALLPNLQRFFWEDVTFRNVFGDRIQSSYRNVHGKSAEYTNKTSSFEGCLDYIFYADLIDTDEPGLECTNAQLMEGDKTAYPNSTWPSDHILLMSTFQMH